MLNIDEKKEDGRSWNKSSHLDRIKFEMHVRCLSMNDKIGNSNIWMYKFRRKQPKICAIK